MMLLNPYRFAVAGGGGIDPAFANVKLLMHCEGSSGTQTYTDSSSYARTLTGSANATVDTSNGMFSSASLAITGGINLSVPSSGSADEWARIGTDAHPLTLELAVYKAGSTPAGFLIGHDGFGTPYWWGLNLTTTGIDLLESGLSASATVPFLATLSSSTWVRLAIAMRGTANREIGVWVNGVWQGADTSPNTPSITNAGSTALNMTRSGGGFQFTGNWDELRISEELFLPWGSDYSLAGAAFPDS